MRLIACILVLILSACDKEVSRSYGEVRVEERSVRCTHPGYCMACGLSFDGKYDCMPRFRPFCPGSQKAKVKVTPVIIKYESGDIRATELTQTTETLEACG